MSLFLEPESSVTSSVADIMSNVASSSSTPPTTVADSDSLHSDISKHDALDALSISEPLLPASQSEPEPEPAFVPLQTPETSPKPESTVVVEVEPSPKRSRRSVASAPVYNLSKLSGTDGHGKRRANGDEVADRRRRTISGDTLVDGAASPTSKMTLRARSRGGKDDIDALDLHGSRSNPNSPRTTRRIGHDSPRARRVSSRAGAGIGATVSSLGSRLSKIGKRGSKAVTGSMTRMSRELLRLRDTKEFSHIDDRPVVHTVWANGKYVDPNAPPPSPPRKKTKAAEPEPEKEADAEPITEIKPRGPKKFLAKGLYAGQDAPTDAAKGLTPAEKKKLATIPELQRSTHVNKVMPSPMYTGFRLLLSGRDFKLPFMTCNPLPPGQPKPDEWKKMTKSKDRLQVPMYAY